MHGLLKMTAPPSPSSGYRRFGDLIAIITDLSDQEVGTNLFEVHRVFQKSQWAGDPKVRPFPVLLAVCTVQEAFAKPKPSGGPRLE